MLHRQNLLTPLLTALVTVVSGAAALALVACAPDTRGTGDDDVGAADAAVTNVDGGDPDGNFVDAGLIPDGSGGGEAFTVYVHSKDTLYTMDPTSFALTTIGTFDPPTADDITDLAVATDGTIFVISKTKLYKADAHDAHVTFVATLSSTPTGGNVGLTFLPSGDLLATDSTGGERSIDPVTGAVHELGSFGNGLATAGDLVATADGTMYAISDTAPGGGTAFANNYLLRVDTSTWLGTAVGQIGAKQVFGAAFINGKVLVFTKGGQIFEVDPATGAGTLKATTVIEFWGAGVSPLVPPIG
jgi:hypothetical protein